jgi:SlyX protein
LDDLNDVVTQQQAKIMQLEQLCNSLVARVRSIGEALPDENEADERPPHY